MTSTSRKWSAVLCDDEMGECLLVSESEERLSGLESDSDNKSDDCAFLDIVVVVYF
jgi:hypothetical protein